MQDSVLIYSIGFIAQLLFSGRLVLQWFYSERAQKVITPSVFWVLSLLASCFLFAYGFLRSDLSIMFGQSLTYFIYIRNLKLQDKWRQMPIMFRCLFWILPVVIVSLFLSSNQISLRQLFHNSNVSYGVLILGICSQLIFTLRFVYQWLYSEKHRRSALPMGFWLLSNIGAGLILIYAIIRLDPVLFMAHSVGIVMYTRNMLLLQKENRKQLSYLINK